MPIVMKIDDRNMRRFVNKMPTAGKRSVARSLNKAMGMTRTRAARETASKRNILIGRAKKEMRVDRATYQRPVASLIARGSPIPVIDVKGAKTQNKLGVKAKITAKARQHLFRGAFIAEMESGHVGVFMRSSKSTRVSETATEGTKRKNLKIFEVVLPSIAATLVQPDTVLKLREFAIPIYERELIRLLNLEMRKAGAR